MRVGSLVFATDQGLGRLAKDFYDNRVVTDVMVVRHGKRATHNEWYPDADEVTNLNDPKQVAAAVRFASEMDVMLFFETPFLWSLFPECRNLGVPTVLMPMYECMPAEFPYRPDVIVNPSALDQSYYPDGRLLPVPVGGVKWRQRVRAKTFVHNAGHGGLAGRNGTREVVEAWGFVKSPARLLLRSQEPLPVPADKRIELTAGTVPFDDLWAAGDVFVFPDKFNGLSLPLAEARAAGMLVMSSDRFPANEWLPNGPLIRVSRTDSIRLAPRLNRIEMAVVSPREIGRTVDEWFGADIADYSLSGRDYAEENSWERLGPVWRDFLRSVVEAKEASVP